MKNLILIGSLLFSLTTLGMSLDPKASTFQWTGEKIAGPHTGKIGVKSSKITEAQGKLKGLEVIMDMNSVTVEDLEGKWATKFLGHILSGDFFETKKYPTATIKVTKVTDKKMKGQLTIKGKTQPIEFPYSKKGKTYTGTLNFDRTKFGIIYGSKNFFKNLGDKVIDNNVQLSFIAVVK